jgi:hypothetical protein
VALEKVKAKALSLFYSFHYQPYQIASKKKVKNRNAVIF